MIIGVPGETAEKETRVALTPPVAEDFVEGGHDVCITAGAGDGSDWTDAQYRDAGCEVIGHRTEVFERSDVVLQVRGLGTTDEPLDPYQEEQVVIGMLGPYDATDETVETLADREVSAFALELTPRTGRAQSMDANSSMASIGGYKAAVMAAEELPKLFPMEMTAAGTVNPADVFVIGAGVAGLKAITTAERMGASSRAYDIRLEVKQEVESLGAEFVELDLETRESGDEEGYAREMDEEFYRQQRKEMARVVPESNVVITTAAIPGAPAPELVTTEMVEEMESGSVIVDLAAESGGNCEPTKADETVDVDGVTVFGPTNLPATVPHTASQLYANNVSSFLQNLLEDGDLDFNFDDEIVDSTLLTYDGTVRAPHENSDGEPDGDDTDKMEIDADAE